MVTALLEPVSLSMLFLDEIGVEHLIPKWRAYSIAFIWILIMVQHMVLFYFFPDVPFEIEMVDSIVGFIIDQIAQDKSRKETPDIIHRQHCFK